MLNSGRKVIAISSKDGRKSKIFQNLFEAAKYYMLAPAYVEFLINSGQKFKQFYFDWLEE